MILKAKHNSIVFTFFKVYALWILKRHFKTIRIIGKVQEKNLPVLLISNHVSWWDGFWAMYVNQKTWHRKFHFMMLEEQLRKYWFFNYTGGYSVNKKSKSMLESLHYTVELLRDNKNLVLIFPQGKIQSMHGHDFQFERGLERVLNSIENTVQIVFLVNLPDYFSNPKPGVYSYIKEHQLSLNSMNSIENSYNQFYKECIEQQRKIQTEQ